MAKAKKRKVNKAFMAPLVPSSALAKVVGYKPIPRTMIVKKLWAYIKKHKLQDKKVKTNIHADDYLKPVFNKNMINMFDMMKCVKKHTKAA